MALEITQDAAVSFRQKPEDRRIIERKEAGGRWKYYAEHKTVADAKAALLAITQPRNDLALTALEQEQLHVLEQTIESGLQTFLDVGTALLVVRESRLYRQGYGTFEEYCGKRWGMGQSRAYQMIDAASVVENLKSSTMVELLPTSERQARPLTKLEPEQQISAWSDAVESAAGGKPTAKQVQKAVAKFAEKPEPFDTPDSAIGAESGGKVVPEPPTTNTFAEWLAAMPPDPSLRDHLAILELAKASAAQLRQLRPSLHFAVSNATPTWSQLMIAVEKELKHDQ